MVGPVRPQFVLFGSSIVQFSFSNGGWGAILADIYARKADILLRGYAGWNSRDAIQIINKVFPKDAPVQPSLVIVYFGGNDSTAPHPSGLGPHVPITEYVENMRRIATHLKVSPSMSMKPVVEIVSSAMFTHYFNFYLQSLSDKTRIIFFSCPPINEEMDRERRRYDAQFDPLQGELIRTNEYCRQYSEACIELCKDMGLKVIDLWTAIRKKENWATDCFTDGIHFTSEASKIVVAEILKVLKEVEWEPSLHWKDIPDEFSPNVS